jgi:2-desacetyl-2-hydroxyethyl bacteriochlorophyllide A dehydrogenase
VREEELSGPAPDEVLVQTIASAISPGTELLIYRNQAPTDITLDETIPDFANQIRYPLKYGYAAVGRVVEVGSKVDASWQGRLVFSFHAHESYFHKNPSELLTVPEDLSPEEAAFLPNMETAVNFLMDGRPLIGERVVVFGQGVVGLLTTALLSRLPLANLITLDRFSLRREKAIALGAHASFDPESSEMLAQLNDLLGGDVGGADLTYELSGNPAALEQSISCTGSHGRVVIGSWYGQKRCDLNLGGRFHRSRIRLVSSQVSTIAPELTGRWSKSRRLQLALQLLRQVRPAHLITHRFPLARAAQAYALIDQQPEDAVQVILTYDS